MTTPLYPVTPTPDTPYNVTDTFRTISSPEYDAGKMVYRSARNYPLFSASLTYGDHSLWTDLTGLYDFFVSCKGSAIAFDFIDFNGWDRTPVGIQWPKLYVGVGTGSTTTFDLPMKSSTSAYLYVNGTDVTANKWVSGGFSGSQWKFLSGTGSNGRDQIQFATAPTIGQIIEWKAVGQRVVQAHFTTDNISVSAFSSLLASTGLAIKEVR